MHKKHNRIICFAAIIALLASAFIPLTIYSQPSADKEQENTPDTEHIAAVDRYEDVFEEWPDVEPALDEVQTEGVTSSENASSKPMSTDTEVITETKTTEPVQSADTETEYAPEDIPESTDISEPVRAPAAVEPPLPTPPEEFVAFTSFLYNDSRHELRFSKELQYFTYQTAQKYDIPYRIVMGLMGVETGWNENAGIEIGSNGRAYVGLGCLDEIYNAKPFAERGIDIYTNQGNIEAICWILHQNMLRYDNIDVALMAYNGGAGYANNKIENGIYESSYTKRVHYFADSLE